MNDLVDQFKKNKQKFLSLSEQAIRHSLKGKLDIAGMNNTIKELKTETAMSMGIQKLHREHKFPMSKRDWVAYRQLKFDTYREYLDHYQE